MAKVAKVEKGNTVAKAIAMMIAATVMTMTAATDHDLTGGMTGTMTGVVAPGTMVDATADGVLAHIAHPRPIQATAIVLSHR